VKDIAREHPRDTIVLITANNKQFGGLPEGLRPELAAEVTNEGLKIGFFGSLDDFLRAHADKIDFITGEWLQQSIRSQDLLTRPLDQPSLATWARLTTQDFQLDPAGPHRPKRRCRR